MSDNNMPARVTSSKASLVLPCLALALTASAFVFGAPARLAHLDLRPAALISNLEFDASIRYEPSISTDQSDLRLVASRRVLDEVLSRQLIALR